MDLLKNSLHNKSGQSTASNQQAPQSGGLMGKLNNMGGGGQAGEHKEGMSSIYIRSLPVR
jgi:hypothetical protein